MQFLVAWGRLRLALKVDVRILAFVVLMCQ